MKHVLGWLPPVALLVSATMVASPVMAADMPLKAPVYKVPPPVFTWTGLYAGGFVGGLWSRTDNSFVFPPPATYNQTSTNGIGGGILGLQYQYNSLVLGAEANLATTFNRNLGSAGCAPAAACAPGFTTTQTLTDVLWTVGGRAGWAIDRWLPYVSGGYANVGLRQTTCIPGACPFESGTATHNGAYIGGGIDWAAFNGWVAGVEYRHYAFETQQIVPIFSSGAGTDVFDTVSTRPRFDTVTFRLSYLFSVMPLPR